MFKMAKEKERRSDVSCIPVSLVFLICGIGGSCACLCFPQYYVCVLICARPALFSVRGVILRCRLRVRAVVLRTVCVRFNSCTDRVLSGVETTQLP